MENKKIIRILIIIISISIIILIAKTKNKTNINTSATKNVSTNYYINEIKTNIKDEQKTVYIKEHKMANNKITGIVKNNTNNTVKYVQVTADYYDKNDNKIDYAMDITNELKAGETWKFEMWTNSNAVKYKNLKVTYK